MGFHGYAGIGTLAYRAYQKDDKGQRLMTEVKPFNLDQCLLRLVPVLNLK
jgi:OOP family OmpA-OmpF porin